MRTQTQVDGLAERMDRGFAELKEMLVRYDERLRGMETREAGLSSALQGRLETAWQRLDEQSAQVRALGEGLARMEKSSVLMEGISRWLLGLLTALIIALLAGLVRAWLGG